MSTADIARGYLRRGWCPIPVPFKSKKPNTPGWQHSQLREEDLEKAFSGKINIGVILGPKSSGLTDVDLDCPEAVALAPHFLERTGAIFGRSSNPNSHWFYQTALAQAVNKSVIQYRDPMRPKEDGMLVEIRIGGETGAQTVFPGSVHETGEHIEWSESGEPAKIENGKLTADVSMLASACLLARYWPREGNRHDAALTLGGFLSRAGQQPAQIGFLVEETARAASDPEHQDRKRAAEDAANAHRSGKPARGFTGLSETFGKEVATRVADWLEYRAPTRDDTAPGEDANKSRPHNGGPTAPANSEEFLALIFIDRHEADLRFVAKWGQWFRWDGSRWALEETLHAFDMARLICREAANACNKPGVAKTLASAKTVAAVERLAKADRKLAATFEQWDTDSNKFNTSEED